MYTADRGITAKIFADYYLDGNLNSIYKKFYKSKPFIRIKKKIQTKEVNNTMFCDIKISKYFEHRLIIMSTLDNIIKGGSGQAIQNFNLMHGFDECIGLPK